MTKDAPECARVVRVGYDTYFITEGAYQRVDHGGQELKDLKLVDEILRAADSLAVRVVNLDEFNTNRVPEQARKVIFLSLPNEDPEERVEVLDCPGTYDAIAHGRHRFAGRAPSRVLEPESLASCLGGHFELEVKPKYY